MVVMVLGRPLRQVEELNADPWFVIQMCAFRVMDMPPSTKLVLMRCVFCEGLSDTSFEARGLRIALSAYFLVSTRATAIMAIRHRLRYTIFICIEMFLYFPRVLWHPTHYGYPCDNSVWASELGHTRHLAIRSTSPTHSWHTSISQHTIYHLGSFKTLSEALPLVATGIR